MKSTPKSTPKKMKSTPKKMKSTPKTSVKEKKKRPAPAHSKLQTEVIKMICEKYNVKYPEGMRKLKDVMKKALGMSYEDAKAKGMTYMEALEKTKKWLKSN